MAYDYDKDFINPPATSLHQAGFHHARMKGYANFVARHITHCPVWLDVGCNWGHFFASLQKTVIDCPVGADYSAAALTLARKENPHIHWLRLSATHLALRPGCCDVVSALEIWGVFTQQQQQQMMAEMVTILRPGGFLLVAIRMGESPHLMTETKLRQQIAPYFTVIDFFHYDVYYFNMVNLWLRPWQAKLDYYINIIEKFRNDQPKKHASILWNILSFFSRYAPLLLLVGQLFFSHLKKLLDKPLTSRWLGSLFWQMGLRRAKDHPSPTGLLLLCQKKAE